VDLVLHLMAQPPWDARMELSANKPFYILHYTYGNDYTLDGKFTPGKAQRRVTQHKQEHCRLCIGAA